MKLTRENIIKLVFIKDNKLYRISSTRSYYLGTLYGIYDTKGCAKQLTTKTFEEIVLYLYDNEYRIYNKIEDLEFKVVNR